MKKDVEEITLKEREEILLQAEKILLQAADVLRCMYSCSDDFDYSCYFEGTEYLKKAAAFIDELILSEK